MASRTKTRSSHARHYAKGGGARAGITRADEGTPKANVAEGASSVSRKRHDSQSVTPAKAGVQSTLLWVPAFAGKTVVGVTREIIEASVS